MKIGVLTQYFPNSAQPWAGHSAYQTVRLLAQRHDVRVFYPEAHYPPLLIPKSRVYTALDPTWQPAGVSVDYIPYTTLPLVGRPFNGLLMARKLLPVVKAWRPDILLNYVIYPDGYAAIRIGRTLNIPVILTAIGSDLNRIPDRVCERHTRTALEQAAFTTTVSHDLLRTAQRLGADLERSAAILNGCDTTLFHARSRDDARTTLALAQDLELVVYVGRLDLRKGLAELIEAIASLAPNHPHLCCFLVGDGPDKPRLLELAAQHKLENVVEFIPACSTSQVALWMAAANLVTLPSYKEGCPNVVIEALASGRPVVASNVGGIPELMDERSGRLVQPHNVTALARALDEVLSSAWNAEHLASLHARSWADVATELESILNNVIQGHQRSGN